jgi:translation initiation factor IF-1
MSKTDTIEVDGVVLELLPNMKFKVQLDNKMIVTAYLCGKMHMKNIRVLTGDRVKLQMTLYDLTKARITYRYK